MPEGPLDFRESHRLACVMIEAFLLLMHLLKRVEEARNRRRFRKWRA
jgi:hypothetical protein